MKKITYILMIIFIIFSIGIILVVMHDREDYKNAAMCYHKLYNEDTIGKGCEKYFGEDTWYIEYLEQEKIHKEN